ncbi:hypothetical protein [Allomuricauda sp. SCSIO 65647]|uniref:hypothetical protein n=1 Tax=Allomuricauda sp. SCSIO 65647 TaxID=2908843 RepID=UPI001F1EF44D|nr:hypothetical protein [Muricauda sp. SCSIO 65647]UJH68134.1 hypothetical protein L0P89_02730 [Muricauda sp. SCSIO 65647]
MSLTVKVAVPSPSFTVTLVASKAMPFDPPPSLSSMLPVAVSPLMPIRVVDRLSSSTVKSSVGSIRLSSMMGTVMS